MLANVHKARSHQTCLELYRSNAINMITSRSPCRYATLTHLCSLMNHTGPFGMFSIIVTVNPPQILQTASLEGGSHGNRMLLVTDMSQICPLGLIINLSSCRAAEHFTTTEMLGNLFLLVLLPAL
eukprot:1542301-Amphidinium_carterae.1